MISTTKLSMYRRYSALLALFSDSELGLYKGLAQIHQQIGLHNSYLTSILTRDRNIRCMPQKLLFLDLSLTTIENLQQDDTSLKALYDFYCLNYPGLLNAVNSIEKQVSSNAELNTCLGEIYKKYDDHHSQIFNYLCLFSDKLLSFDLNLIYKYLESEFKTAYISDANMFENIESEHTFNVSAK